MGIDCWINNSVAYYNCYCVWCMSACIFLLQVTDKVAGNRFKRSSHIIYLNTGLSLDLMKCFLCDVCKDRYMALQPD